jgi:hypothetical protein
VVCTILCMIASTDASRTGTVLPLRSDIKSKVANLMKSHQASRSDEGDMAPSPVPVKVIASQRSLKAVSYPGKVDRKEKHVSDSFWAKMVRIFVYRLNTFFISFP